MPSTPSLGDGYRIVHFAQQMMELLDRGGFTSTYKHAVLLGLMDLCLEKTNQMGAAPSMVTTRELAEKVLSLYWDQTRPYPVASGGSASHENAGAEVLRQNRGGQAKILSAIDHVKAGLSLPQATLFAARIEAPDAMEALLDEVEWIVILMPLPRLQTVGGQQVRCLYAINWDENVRKGAVRAYQRGQSNAFDNSVRLLEGVGDYLVRLSGLLRPLIQREWVRMVASMNGLEEERLERFLFESGRQATQKLRSELRSLQHNRCFYCAGRMSKTAEVDHFIPFARYPDNAIQNLVLAHRRCNRDKRDRLAAQGQVRKWAERFRAGSSEGLKLRKVAASRQWESAPERTLGVARALYGQLAPGALLWNGVDDLVQADMDALRRALAFRAA